MKFAAVTTFPKEQLPMALQTLASFRKHWNIPLVIYLDDLTFGTPEYEQFFQQIQPILEHPEDGLIVGACQEQQDFMARHAGKDDPKDYRKMLTRWSHKVFAISEAVRHYGDAIDFLVWIDADVMTTKEVTHEDLMSWAPLVDAVSYLGRKDWSASETGFIMFNMVDKHKEARKLIEEWQMMYVTDAICSLPEQTDAYAFDKVIANYGSLNLTRDIPGRDVFDQSPLAGHMTHYKGNRKKALLPVYSKPAGAQAPQQQHSNAMTGQSFNTGQLNIVTQNCVPDEVIKKNIQTNLQIIPHWLETNSITDEEIAICSAGPSLSVDEVLPLYDRGVKIVAVKHALKTLQKGGIKPWAVILLDPREHVKNFVKFPDRDVLWFVASMVDPEVSDHLVKSGCKVFGYHAAVGADELKLLPRGHRYHIGGSATSTRGISLLKALGFRKMHLFGYDCCYFQKPDLLEKKDNGRLKYEEVTLETPSWGGKTVSRTWWTEGQFLAQVQEMEKIYFNDQELDLTLYGDGIIPWVHKHRQKFAEWQKYIRKEDNLYANEHPSITEWISTKINGTHKPSNPTF